MRIYSLQPNLVSDKKPLSLYGVNNRFSLSFQGCKGACTIDFAQKKSPELILYTMENCPWCKKVIAYLKRHKLEYSPMDVSKRKDLREEVVQLGGKSQVPFLVDKTNNVQMYESIKIVEYLRNEYIKPTGIRLYYDKFLAYLDTCKADFHL